MHPASALHAPPHTSAHTALLSSSMWAEAEQARVAREEEQEAAAAECEYQVEGILGKRVEGEVNQYRVIWLNYSSVHNSWEPATNLKGCEM